MARLLNTPYPMPSWNAKLSFDNYIKQSDEALDKIPEERVFRWPVADGYAYYYVVSFRPLVLQLIPYLDAYCLPYAHIRGLREKDVRYFINTEITLNKFLSREEKK